MKTKKLITFAAATLILAACNNENSDKSPIPLRISSGVVTQTKAITANTQDTQIISGEKVGVWVHKTSNDAQAVYHANLLTASGTGTFSGGTPMYYPQDGDRVNIYAIHGKPDFSANDPRPSSARLCSVNTDQTTATNVAQSDLLFAIKKDIPNTTSTVPMTFYHMLSKVKIGIKIGAGAPALASSGAVKINGVIIKCHFTPNYTADMTNATSRSNMITALLGETGTVTASQNTTTDFTTYNDIILPPQNIADKKLTITLADGGVMSYTFPIGSTLVSGKKHSYNITLNLTGLTVTSSIESWGAVTPVSGDATLE